MSVLYYNNNCDLMQIYLEYLNNNVRRTTTTRDICTYIVGM